MTEGEANRLSMCGYGCNVIGGPWISTNPACPVCNGSDDEPAPYTECSICEYEYSCQHLGRRLCDEEE